MQTKLLGNHPTGLIFVVSAPAGTGKTTLVHLLTREFPAVVQSISYTTRAPRYGEMEGREYHFISVEEFKHKIAKWEFLEYVELYGDYYGTCLDSIRKLQKQGRHVLLVIDTQGAKKIKKILPAVFIFIQPPSLEELRARLVNRNTESIEVIEKRLKIAANEIEAGVDYDYQIINEDLNISYQVLRSIVIAEEHRIAKLRL